MKKSRHALSLRAWIGLTGMAIAGLAIFMGLWLKPQWEEAAGGWTPLNEAIAGRLAAGEEGRDMGNEPEARIRRPLPPSRLRSPGERQVPLWPRVQVRVSIMPQETRISC